MTRAIRALSRVAARAAAAACLVALAAAPAAAYTVSGRFLYEDRMWDRSGYTGAVQNLPVRHAKVEIVDGAGAVVLATTSTGLDGRFSVAVATDVPLIAARVVSDGRPAGYQMRVVDNFVRVPGNGLILTASQLYAVTTDAQTHLPAANVDVGEWLMQDEDGTGVAQAFNIFDNGVDFFDYVASIKGELPLATEFLVYAWDPQSNPSNPPPLFGSNYQQQGIFIGTNPDPTATDTDGWSDTVILHETGHWYDDMYSRSDNPGGGHTLPDNSQDPRLSYGEGSATYHCAKVREFRALRPNLSGQPIDNHISTYADLLVPPDVGTPGALSFSYDFEIGVMYFPDATTGAITALDIGQRGSACETNVTSALWDLLDGPATRDETPGVDDDGLEAGDQLAWDIEHVYLPSVAAINAITVEDYVQGWFARNGAGFHAAELNQIFVGLARMPFAPDPLEPDNGLAGASPVTPIAYTASLDHIAINEIDVGPYDAIELYNGTITGQDMTGWQIEVYVNGTTNDATRVYTFPAYTLAPGEVVVVHEGGDPASNGRVHLYGGSTPAANVFNISWNYGLDGAVVLRRPDGSPVDFVRWRDAAGVNNTTPIPAGTSFVGLLDSPLGSQTLQRDLNGFDSDGASDFAGGASLMGYVNHPSPSPHTLYDVGDQDVISFQAQAGNRYGFETRGPFSDTDTRLELLGPDGSVLGANDDVEPGFRDSRVDFYAAQAGTFYLRVTHVGSYTDYAEYDLMAFRRPIGSVLATPSALEATARNNSDVGDPVALRFLPAGAYDSSAVYRDGTRIATLGPGVTQYTDHVDRGVHNYEVSGFIAGQESGRARDWEFAGDVTCHSEDDFEQGNANLWVSDLGTWNVTASHASQGTFSFTDSPGGLYRSCNGVLESCFMNTIATFGVPTNLPAGSTLEFDHICITEAAYDFGILEVSVNDGGSWIELGRYDESAYPEWADLVADPGDWKHASFDLSGYENKQLLVRFRLYSDSNLEHDGWYVDAVHVNAPGCTEVPLDVPLAQAGAVLRFLPPSPNPMRGLARFVFTLPAHQDRVDVAIHDVSGRVVRYERLGVHEPGNHTWTWNGRDGQGREAASGVYFVRLLAGKNALTQKVLKVGG